MNKRITIVDGKEVNVINYIGLQLPNLKTIANLMSMSELDRNSYLTLGPGDAAFVIGSEAFKILREIYHFGIRNENYYDCSLLQRLSIEGGAFIKVQNLDKLPTSEEVQYFLSPEFCKERDFSYFKQTIVHSYQESNPFLDYFINLPVGTYLGFDYEASGMPMDVYYEITGAALSTMNSSAFFSFSDIKRDCQTRGDLGLQEWQIFLKRFGEILQKHQSYIWTYNLQYEQQATWRVFGLDLEFCDSSVFNIIEAFHMKKYSLKWTAQRVLGATVWDTDFDRLSDLFDEMYFTEVQDPNIKGKKGLKKILKVTPQNYDQTPEWTKINQLYPGYEMEFRQLIGEYFGQPFMNIPSNILGFYCNLDAFYTLEICLETKDKYSQDCIDVFLDNLRMGAVLHSCGMYKDEAFRRAYDIYCQKMMAFGITYCSTARCKIKMKVHSKKANKIESYDPFCRMLIERYEFFNGNAFEITKNLLSTNIDTSIQYDPNKGNESEFTGLNTGGMMMKYGMEYYDYIVAIDEALKEVLSETKNNKPKTQYKYIDVVNKKTGEIKSKKVKDIEWTVQWGPIDDGILRKKKILELMTEKIYNILGLGSIDLGEGHQELEKYIFWKKSYDEFMKVWQQLPDINNVPDQITFIGKTYTDLLEYSDYVSDIWFKCKSPEENDTIIAELMKEYRVETIFLSAIGESFQQMKGEYNFYKNLGINTIEEAFIHFRTEWNDWMIDKKMVPKGNPSVRPQGYTYPDKVFNLSDQFLKNSKDVFKNQKELSDYEVRLSLAKTPADKKLIKDQKPAEVAIDKPLKTTWADFAGFYKQASWFSYIKKNQYKELGNKFLDSDMKDDFFFMRKLSLNYLLYKKYAKLLSTYMRGMFLDKDQYFIVSDRNFMPIRHAAFDENGNLEPGAVRRVMSTYKICEKTSKRSSSAWHTIPSHQDLKAVPIAPKGYLLNYYDISSAEVNFAV